MRVRVKAASRSVRATAAGCALRATPPIVAAAAFLLLVLLLPAAAAAAGDARASSAFWHTFRRTPTASGDGPSAEQSSSSRLVVLGLLRELFSDIDWDTIASARDQIVKFIHRLQRLISVVRNGGKLPVGADAPSSHEQLGASAAASLASVLDFGGGDDYEDDDDELGGYALFAPRRFGQATANETTGEPKSGREWPHTRWWWQQAPSPSSPPPPKRAELASVKELLERVACFVGYIRLLNHSNEALGELDASRLILSLLGGASQPQQPPPSAFGGFSAAKSWLG